MHRSVHFALLALASACSTPSVGAPCLPEQIPEEGFDVREAYVESSSLQCETRTCLVFRLEGDPRETCVDSGDDTQRRCADPTEVEERVYCSCRCRSPEPNLPECECPDGFSCVDVLEQGGDGVRGGYCIKAGTG